MSTDHLDGRAKSARRGVAYYLERMTTEEFDAVLSDELTFDEVKRRCRRRSDPGQMELSGWDA